MVLSILFLPQESYGARVFVPAQTLIGVILLTWVTTPLDLIKKHPKSAPSSSLNFGLICVKIGTAPSMSSGYLAVVNTLDLNNPNQLKKVVFGGQPDSIFVSPNKKYAIAVIKNQQTDDGRYPQNQTISGFIATFNISKKCPDNWVRRPNVALTDLPGLHFEYDPEPEYASISNENIAAVALQENNVVVFINITDGKVIQSIHAGRVNLKNVYLKRMTRGFKLRLKTSGDVNQMVW
jgi:hypothetical protein